jgi:hypothetical protein
MKGGEKGKGRHSTFEKGATCLRGMSVCVWGGGLHTPAPTLHIINLVISCFIFKCNILKSRRITLYWAAVRLYRP